MQEVHPKFVGGKGYLGIKRYLRYKGLYSIPHT
jgi:hypothetical protein